MNEDFIELKCYIKYNLYYGHPMLEIKKALIDSGWNPNLIEQALNETQQEHLVPKPKRN